jgi:phage-related minor tail protein
MAGKTAILSVKILGDSSGAAKAMRDTEKSAATLEKSFDKMTDAAAVGGTATAVAFGAAYLNAVSVEGGQKKLADQLGLDPNEQKIAGAASGQLYADGYGESLQAVNDSIKNVIGNIPGMDKATQESLEAVSASVMNVSDTFEQDLGQTTVAVGQLMRTGMAKDADEALGIITKGLQSNTRAGDDLLDTLTEYPAGLSELGLTGQEAMGLMTQGLDAGARSTDLVADALKEFGIRGKDASALSAEGFAAVGLNAEDMTAKIAAGGEGAREGLDQVLDGLRNMEDPVARDAAAVALFGSQAEDLQGALYALDPSSATAALGEVAGAADSLGTTQAETALVQIQRAIETAFTEAAAVALPVIAPLLQSLREFAPILVPLAAIIGVVSGVVLAISAAMKVYAAVQVAQTAIQWASNAAWLASPITWIVLAIVAALALVIGIVVVVIQHWDQIAAKGAEVWAGIIAWIDSVAAALDLTAEWEAIKFALANMGAVAEVIWTAFIAKIDAVAESLNLTEQWEAIKTALGVVGDVAKGVWDGLVSGINGVIGAVQSAVSWFGQLFGAQDTAATKGANVGAIGDVSAQRVASEPSSMRMMALSVPEDTSTMRLATTATAASVATAGTVARRQDAAAVTNNYYTTVEAGISSKSDVARQVDKVMTAHERRRGSAPAAGAKK